MAEVGWFICTFYNRKDRVTTGNWRVLSGLQLELLFTSVKLAARGVEP